MKTGLLDGFVRKIMADLSPETKLRIYNDVINKTHADPIATLDINEITEEIVFQYLYDRIYEFIFFITEQDIIGEEERDIILNLNVLYRKELNIYQHIIGE